MSGGLVTFIGDNHSGFSQSGSDRRAPSQNPQQRWYTIHGDGALDRFSDWAALG
jgi:hypothetical protein